MCGPFLSIRKDGPRQVTWDISAISRSLKLELIMPIKVGQALMDPFGTDDEDFELNWILDRNVFVGYQMVDFTSDQLPAPSNLDIDGRTPHIPYTKASAKIRDPGAVSHLGHVKLKEKELELIFHNEPKKPVSPRPVSVREVA